jgi:type VI secretion system protein VasD
MQKTLKSSPRSDPNHARARAFSKAPKWGGISVRPGHWTRRLAVCSGCVVLAACSTTQDGSGVLDRTLQVVGLQRAQPALPGLEGVSDVAARKTQPSAQKIALRLHAGEILNTDGQQRSLSLVARIYKLRDRVAFEATPYADFQELKPVKAPEFAADVVDVKELVLTPGKRYDVIETVGADAPYFAVVALFRSPAEQRWRFVFDSRAAAVSGVTLGVHACAMSVSAGLPLGVAPEGLRVAGVQCPSPGS